MPSLFLAAESTSPSLPAIAAVAAGLGVFGLLALRLAWLGPRGAAAAWVLGLASFLALRGGGLAALFAPFLGATILGKLPGAERAPARDLRQVLCNGTPAFLGCLMAISGRPDLGGPFLLGAMACLGADSCATEAGVRWGGDPFRIAGRGPIRKGESGGVTWAGLVAAVLGSALAPGAFAACTGLPLVYAALLAAAGVGGCLLDSVLGGSLQFRGRDPETGTPTERPWLPSGPAEHVAGWRWLDNDAVNLLSGMAGGVLAIALTALA